MVAVVLATRHARKRLAKADVVVQQSQDELVLARQRLVGEGEQGTDEVRVGVDDVVLHACIIPDGERFVQRKLGKISDFVLGLHSLVSLDPFRTVGLCKLTIAAHLVSATTVGFTPVCHHVVPVDVGKLSGELFEGHFVFHACIIPDGERFVQRKLGKILDPRREVVADEEAQQAKDGGGSHEGEGEVVVLALHAPIIPHSRRIASTFRRNMSP